MFLEKSYILEISLEEEYISIHRQAEILARIQKECYPDWVVFFIYRNMTNNIISESVSSSENTPLSAEAKNRVDAISTIIDRIVRENIDGEKIVLHSFNENLRRQITSNPGAVAVALNDVEERYQASLANKTGSEKYQANKDHITYLEKI